jgi:ketosteroid isomerase-like protein
VSAQRQELIRDLWQRWNQGEREIDPAEVDPDAEVHSVLTRGTYCGYEGIKDWWAEIDDQFESWRLSIEEMSDLPGDRVLAIGYVHFRGRGSGVEFDQPIGWIVRFAGEKIAELTNYPDHARARAAAERSS